MRRRPPERPRRVRIGRQHAQDVESVERRVSRDATRAHSLCAAPASSQTVRRLLADTSTGAGLVRRRPPGRPRRVRVARRQTQGVGRVERSVPPDADRAHGLRAAPASSRLARFFCGIYLAVCLPAAAHGSGSSRGMMEVTYHIEPSFPQNATNPLVRGPRARSVFRGRTTAGLRLTAMTDHK